ncbi:MAG: hypothetical protein JNK53_06365 [Phycisphaerae bacterium]|nr:hypothetical protein [Phycisphaerae bacterium]
MIALLGACKKPRYDTSSPERTVESMQKMVKDGSPELLLDLVWLEPRPLTFSDGVTEASAIEDVRTKTKSMVKQLWRVSKKLNQRFPKEVQAELAKGGSLATGTFGGGFGDVFARIMTDPFGWLDANRDRLKVEDLGDGTAAIEIDGAPVLGGLVSMGDVNGGWKLVVPVELAHSTKYFPDTREEWAVVAYLMLAVENAMNDFESELDAGKFKNLGQASERVGRLIAEGAAAQAIIYALMQENQPGKDQPNGDASAKPAGSGAAASPPLERTVSQTGEIFQRQIEGR